MTCPTYFSRRVIAPYIDLAFMGKTLILFDNHVIPMIYMKLQHSLSYENDLVIWEI